MSERLLKLLNRSIVPPCGYTYVDPDTKHQNIASHFDQLLMLASKHRAANDLKVAPNFPEIIEDNICRRSPITMTNAGEDEYPAETRPLTSSTVQMATKQVLWAWRKDGRRCVSTLEASERGLICSNCHLNTQTAACYSCKGLIAWIKQWLKNSTPIDGSLYVCRVTAVLNVAHIHLRPEAIKAYSSKHIAEKHPEKCWKRILLLGEKNADKS